MEDNKLKFLKLISLIFLSLTIFLNIFTIKNKENTIYIGTKNLTEQQIIANIYKQLIENKTNYQVQIIPGLDATSFINQALEKEDIDMYIEYTFTSYLEIFKHKYTDQTNEEINKELMEDYQKQGLKIASFLGFENSNVLICANFCNEFENIKDLDKKEFTFAAPAYFFERNDGYKILTEKYDLSKVKVVKADPIITYTGILNGNIDLGLSFSTDPKTENLKVLKDTEHVFPKYEAILVTNSDIYTKFPDLEPIVNELSGQISTEEIQELNRRIENENKKTQTEVNNYIKNNFQL